MEVKRVPGWDGTIESAELYHHGIKGQRWGVRRYQNHDGTLTAAGKARYGSEHNRLSANEYLDYESKEEQKALKKDAINAAFTYGPCTVGMLVVGTMPISTMTLPVFAGAAGAGLAGAAISAAIKRTKNKRLDEARDSMSDAQKELLKNIKELDIKYDMARVNGDITSAARIENHAKVLRTISETVAKGEDTGRTYTVSRAEDGGLDITSNRYNPKKHATTVYGYSETGVKHKQRGGH